MDTEPAAVVAPPAEAPAAPAAETPAAAPPAPVVDLMGEDLAATYPKLKEMEESEAKGLKFPVERAWLDKQMEDPKFRATINGFRGVATRDREATVAAKKAVQADREALALEHDRTREHTTAVEGQLAKLQALVDKLPKAPPVPAGGEPDPKSPNQKVQEYYLTKQIAALLEPVRADIAKLAEETTKAGAEAEVTRLEKANDAFIAKTSDFAAHFPAVMKLIESREATSVEAAYHIAKGRAVAATPVAPPAADTGPDLSKMTSTQVTQYALEHPGWKLPADWRARMKI